jgi:hypothetical protein
MQSDMVTLLMTSTLLVAGGLGIYLWKSNNEEEYDASDIDNNDVDKNNDYNDEYNEDYSEEKPIQKKGGKTRRSRKRHTGTKRRHF